jgi:hypothetical protein
MDLMALTVSLFYNLLESALLFVVFRRAGFQKAWLVVPFVPVMIWLFWLVFDAAIAPDLDSESFFARNTFYYLMRIFSVVPLMVLAFAGWPKLRSAS